MSRNLRGRVIRTEALAPAVAAPAVGYRARPADEARELARATAAAFTEMVQLYRDHYQLSAQEAVARTGEDSPAGLDRAQNAAPDQVSWTDLDTLARHDPAAAVRRWEEVKEAARGELRTGERAGQTTEVGFQTCWSRARFLAVRAELIDAIRPRDGAELLLIDQMAVYQVQLWAWQTTLTAYTSVADLGRPGRRADVRHEPPRLTDAEAMEQAAAMVERFQRLFLKALAALQALRRQPSVVVRHARQVNVAEQQINVTN
jgi:hypothetical protein